MRFDDTAGDWQPQPRPLVACVAPTPVAIEHVRQILGRDPRSGVCDRENQIPFLWLDADGYRTRPDLAGISHEIGDDLHDSVAITRDRRSAHPDLASERAAAFCHDRLK